MSFFDFADGYYGDDGWWHRMKHCFVDCGCACTCRAPGGIEYSEAHDVRLQAARCAAIAMTEREDNQS